MTSEHSFSAEMLTLARESARLSQTILADLTPYDQSVISRMESGELPISAENVLHFARALAFPKSFFAQTDRVYGLGASFLYHRKRQRMRIPDLRKIEADANIIRIQLAHLLRGIDWEHENSFVPMEVGVDGTPSQIASLLRASWRLPSGPIRNIAAAAENAGALVAHYRFHVDTVDGIHTWITGLPPIFILNSNMPGDRVRWTLAHEIAHAILHRHPTQDIESQADEFASEFLMPAKDIAEDLRDLTLPKAAALKLTWKTSIQALIRRAHDIGAITNSRYKSLYVQLSKAGYRRREPNEIPLEPVSTIRRLINMHMTEHQHTIESLCALARASRDFFDRVYLDNPSEPQLRIAR